MHLILEMPTRLPFTLLIMFCHMNNTEEEGTRPFELFEKLFADKQSDTLHVLKGMICFILFHVNI